MDELMNGWMEDGWMDGSMGGSMDGSMDGWIDGSMDRWIDRWIWMNGSACVVICRAGVDASAMHDTLRPHVA